MKGKKKEETVDVTNLPKINTFTASIIFSSENIEKRYKLLDTIQKSNHKFVRLITRENLIEFAKEKGFFIEPAENKKDPNPVEKRDINSEELAKSAAAIITDRSIPMMRDKKALLDKIEELKKQKEEAIFARDNPQPVDPKKPAKPADKNKAAPVNPDDIIIPVIDEFAVDLAVVFYNYPLDKEEAHALEKEQTALNHLLFLKDVDEFIPAEEPKEEVNLDPKAKKQAAPAKDAKGAANDTALLQKHFSAPPKNAEEIFFELKKTKYLSQNNSLLRLIYFDIWEFTAKTSSASAPSSASPDNSALQKKDAYSSFLDLYAEKLNGLNKFLIYYLKWSAETSAVKLGDFADEPTMQRKISGSLIQKLILETDMKKKDFEHMSVGAVLISFYIDLVKHMREINHIGEHNMIIYEKNDVDNLFEKLEKEIIHEYSTETKASSVQGDQNEQMLLNSHMLLEQQREIEKQEQDINKIDELSSYFKLIIDEKDLILKNALDNEIEKFMLGEREKAFNLFRKFPGIGRNLMPDVPPKEENFRKAKKCEIYPFLDTGIGIPLYEKYDIIKKFEEILKEKITEYNFDFGDRVYQEIMNRDLLTQTLGNAMLFDTETLFHYNERDDNLLFSTYYRCPKGRIYRKTNKYRYLSKPHFDNWINCFKPVFFEKANKDNNNNNLNNENNNNQELNMSAGKSKPGTPMPHNQSQPHINNEVSAIQGKAANDLSNQDMASNHNFFVGGANKNEKKPEIIFGNNFDSESQLLYDADDIYLGEVTERIKYMFPSDNGVFIKKVIENGIFKSYNSYVIKDNLVFGIKKNKENIPEFWMKFDNDVIMTVNNIGEYESLQENYDAKNGTYTNFTFKNGLNVQILPNGDISQKIEKLDDDSFSDCETHRIITSKASIISHHKMNKTNVLYANGNVCAIQGGTAVNTNNKGYRVARRLQDNFEYEMDPVAITIQSDPETNSKF